MYMCMYIHVELNKWGWKKNAVSHCESNPGLLTSATSARFHHLAMTYAFHNPLCTCACTCACTCT